MARSEKISRGIEDRLPVQVIQSPTNVFTFVPKKYFEEARLLRKNEAFEEALALLEKYKTTIKFGASYGKR